MHNVPPDVYNNSSWFLYYTSKLDMDRIKESNRRKAMQTSKKVPLRGQALLQALRGM